jgi:hypothetical protein
LRPEWPSWIPAEAPLLFDEFHQPAQRRDEGVVPDAEIADRAATAPLDLG